MKVKPQPDPTEEKFLLDVAEHQMIIMRDAGTDRHLRFKRANTSNQYFDLITWPGVLCYHGDMGTFVFSRIEDMFEFFREYEQSGPLKINLGYWAEKLRAVTRHDGYEKFSSDLFKQRVMEYAKDCGADRPTMNVIRDEVLPKAEDGEQMAYYAAYNFEHDGFRLTDFYEINCREYTYYFVWCCYAIVWAIRQYDKYKAMKTGTEIVAA